MAAPAIRAHGLRKTYRSGSTRVEAVRGVSLEVARGEFVALCGPSGSGKSTLLNLLAGLDRPDDGVIEIAGEPVDFADERRRAALLGRRIGFVFQSFNLMPVLSALENVELPLWSRPITARKRRAMALAMLERVGLAERAHHRPLDLSGGQQQRVAVARALVGEPEVVFADEPTANLDGATAEALLALMADLNRRLGTSFVFSTHDARVMRFASRRIALSDGEVRP